MNWRDFAWEYWGACLMLAALSALLLILLPGCFDMPRPAEALKPPPQHPGGAGPGATLAALGATCTWIGGIALVAGVVVRVAAVAVPVLTLVGPVAGVAAACGSVCLACGLSLQWLAGNLWLVALVAVGGGGLAVAVHWRHLRPDAGRLVAQAQGMMRRHQRMGHAG